MPGYRKKRPSDVWHWCTNCEEWPTSDYESVTLLAGRRPSSGELDNKCKSKESKGHLHHSRMTAG